jgi:hypothetical protein
MVSSLPEYWACAVETTKKIVAIVRACIMLRMSQFTEKF